MSTATALARELADLMRANKDVALQTSAAANPYLGSFRPADGLPTATQDCYATRCTAYNVGAYNMREWLTRVRTALPGARITVCFDDGSFDASGTARWACTSSGNAIAVVKIGWTRQGLGGPQEQALNDGDTSPPVVILPLIAGSAT